MDTALGTPQAYPSTPGMYNLTTQADGKTVSPAAARGAQAAPL
jgi:hypothetical protein